MAHSVVGFKTTVVPHEGGSSYPPDATVGIYLMARGAVTTSYEPSSELCPYCETPMRRVVGGLPAARVARVLASNERGFTALKTDVPLTHHVLVCTPCAQAFTRLPE